MNKLTTKYLNDLKEKMAKHSREACYITWRPQDNPPSHTSRLGGQIVWSSDTPYPHCHQRPLVFLAQINFAELSTMQDYPQQGLLQFFIADDDVMGCSFEEESPSQQTNSSYRVVYWSDLACLDTVLEPVVTKYSPHCPEKSYVMQFELVKQSLNIHDVIFEKALGYSIYDLPVPDGVDEEDIYEELQEDIQWTSQVGGYASFTQQDPRSY